MKKDEIVIRLKKNTKSILNKVEGAKSESLYQCPDKKWSAIEQVDHLLRSIQPLNKALRIPLPGLRILFGKANHSPRTFDQMQIDYQRVLDDGGKATARYIPTKKGNKEVLTKSYAKQSEALFKNINSWKEKDLDQYYLPHPLLGKLIIREMLYFTIFHTEMHGKRISELLVTDIN